MCDGRGEHVIGDQEGRLQCLEARNPSQIPGARRDQGQVRLASLYETCHTLLEAF
jgi:hypothetical protein